MMAGVRIISAQRLPAGDRTFKLSAGITSEPRRYVKSLGGAPWRDLLKDYREAGDLAGLELD
jgi:hypothetical protein